MHLIPDICQFFADKRGRKWSSRINKFDILKRRKKKKSRNDEAYFRTSPYSSIIHPLQTVTQTRHEMTFSLCPVRAHVCLAVCVYGGCQFWAVPYYRPQQSSRHEMAGQLSWALTARNQGSMQRRVSNVNGVSASECTSASSEPGISPEPAAVKALRTHSVLLDH